MANGYVASHAHYYVAPPTAQLFGATEFFNPKDHDRPTQQVFSCNYACNYNSSVITGAN